MKDLMNDVAPKVDKIAGDFYAFLGDWDGAVGDVVKAVLKALYDGIA